MKRKTQSRSNSKRVKSKMDGLLGRTLQLQLGQVSMFPLRNHQLGNKTSSEENRSLFQNLLEAESVDPRPQYPTLPFQADGEVDADADDKDFILSQDFFCTPDYITPDNQQVFSSLDFHKENSPCPKSPEKLKTVKSKLHGQDDMLIDPLSPILFGNNQIVELANDVSDVDEVKIEKMAENKTHKTQSYVSQSAVALRCRVMPPPCIRNPYLKDSSETDIDPFENQRLKFAGIFPSLKGGDGLSRYHTDFHEIKKIGTGNFSCVFSVLKRIDGCMYAVKKSTRPLHQDTERRKALMEVQTLAALGSHENVVGYYSSWFESDQLYIQLELCDHSLSRMSSHFLAEGGALVVLYQVAKALQFIHERGIAHLDLKPDNIYVKNGTHKLGDFGCATLLDKSLPIEEGDARYMPHEILNENYDNLDKVDIFSLGASVYELVRGSPLPESGNQFMNLREGKLPLLPGHSLQFQNLLKVMVDPDPARRPSAKELVNNPIFDRIRRDRDV